MFTVVVNTWTVCVVEPGYYEDGDFGIRIENLILIVEADTKVSMYDLPAHTHILQTDKCQQIILGRLSL